MNSGKVSVTGRPARKTSRKWMWAVGLVLLAAAGAAGWYFLLGPGAAAKAASASGPDYHTTVVRRGDIRIAASGTGTLVASQTVDLSFSSKGIVSTVNVKAGDVVQKGQVLARIGSSAALEAAVASDQLALLQDQQALSTLQQNANVALAQAFQSQVKAQQDYNNALTSDQRTAYARCSKETNIKLKTVLDAATSKLQDISQRYYGSDAWINARNNYDQALANYQYCITYTPGEITNASASLQVAKVNLQQAQDTYKTLSDNKGIDPIALSVAQSKVQADQTRLTQDQENLQGLTLTAPMDGTVTFLAGNAGASADTSKFITISDLSHPTLQVNVDETDLDKFTAGSAAQVVFDALPEQTFTGTVSQVNPQLTSSGQVNVATGLVLLDQSAAKSLQNLPLGLSASVTIIQKQAMNVLIVPLTAVRDLGNGQYSVFVVGKDGQLQLRFVQVGLEDSAQAEITSGLNAGDVVSTGAIESRQTTTTGQGN